MTVDIDSILAELAKPADPLRDQVKRWADLGREVPALLAEIRQMATELDRALSELRGTTAAWDVAAAALSRIRETALLHGDASLVTIAEHALRVERWDPPLWVCAVCSWTSSESEPCPQHGHTGESWCCDTCRERVEQAAQAVSVQ